MSRHYRSNRSPLQLQAFTPLPLGAVRPAGWLLAQCRVQANGLTGHLEEFWPDLGANNMWLGGDTEGWERGPYYLDGLVPLAHVLDDARLKAMAARWLDSIFTMQDESGWIGPVQAPYFRAYDQWPLMIVLKVLAAHHDATGDARVITMMTRFCVYLRDILLERPLFDWGLYRWADLVLSLHWLYNRTGEAWLLEVAAQVAQQGYDWRGNFEHFRFTGKVPRQQCALETHGVNNAMAVKAGGVWWRQSGADADRRSVYRAIEMLDAYHGQVTGAFSCDEHLAGRDPSQGTELCTVVEYMFSLEELLAIFGDPTFGDRLERIAYNALPATFTPDMWAHQYDQQVNQVLCSVAARQWTTNGDDSNIYGLEPNYGCCTANFHQGWPKLVRNLWLASPGDGLAAVVYGPCQVSATVGDGTTVTIEEDTEYPFRDEIRFTLHAPRPVKFPLLLRIPAWATQASVRVGGEPARNVVAGAFVTVERTWHDGDRVVLKLPMEVCLERRYQNSVAVVRGPLVFALRIGEEFRLLKGEPPHADWAVHPTTPWNYGLVLGDQPASELFSIREAPVGEIPFSHAAAPVTLTAKACRVPQWTMEEHSAGPLPPSPVAGTTPLEQIELIPYGSTNLRIGEFPEVVKRA